LRAPGRVADPRTVDDFEAQIRRAGKRDAAAARPLWEERHGPLAAIDRLAGAARDGVASLTAEVASTLDALFAAPRRASARRLTAEELEDADAHAAVHGALDELAGLATLPGVPSPPPAEVLEALEALELPGRAPALSGRVLVADPLAVRARRFRALFLCGLQEGEFPHTAPPDPFLSEEARAALVAKGLDLRVGDDRLGDERFLFYAAASRPERWLYLSYRTSDEEGRPVVPSFFVDEVRALHTERLHEERRRRPLRDVTWPAGVAPTAAELERSLAATGPTTAPPPISDVTSVTALAELANVERVSAGALETFHDCPVKWLVEKRLRPRRLSPDDEPLTRGSFAHQVLERTFRELRERTGSGRVTAATLPLAESLADTAIEAHRDEHHLAPTTARARAAEHLVRADVRRLLAHEAQAESSFDPSDFELSFGFEDQVDDSLPPLVLGDGEVRLRGRVDRVDVDDTTGRAIVRDYKTGKPAPEHPGGKWAEGGQLQVALYMLAVARLTGREAAGGVYQPLRAVGRKLRARGLLLDVPEVRALTESTLCPEDLCPPEAFAAALAEAEATAVRLAGGMRAGRLTPAPDTCAYRGGCAYPGICRSVAA
ncbi:MAG: hypothetical protein QOK04_1468, partial [Solirubrobacteraceae bacterium]|nr:hypothetical protein [Solirubrobacteraceae bacterium]